VEWDKTKAMRKIITSQDCPPIPVRDYDWSAVREDWDECDFIGYGRTEQDAIDDLLEQEEFLR
jgi:hypothetical protein